MISHIDDKEKKHFINVDENTILLDAINEAGISDVSVFGICDKQLACHSCAVHIRTKYVLLDKPNETEKDVHCELGEIYRENSTRMSCQIKCDLKFDGMEIEIPRSSFFLFQNGNDEDKI